MKPGQADSGWGVLRLIGLLIVFPAVSYGQVDPIKLNPVSGRTQSVETITSADVLARVELLRDELELIRIEMGHPRNSRLHLK